MALLSRPVRDRAGLLAASAALVLAGCYFVEKLHSGEEEEKLAFSHRIHVEDQGLDCTDCHGGAEDSDDPGMPFAAQCGLCHADLDSEKAPEEQVASLFVGGTLAARQLSALDDEVIFSHLRHVEAGMDCSACHGVIEETGSILPEVAVSMARCMDCHQSLSIANDCATCHSEIRMDRAPPSHDLAWLDVHGDVARAHSADVSADCAMCHSENSCTECHLTEMPRSHTSFWRRRGHGQIAAFDRDSCSTCHQPDSCNRCHQETLPVSHRGSWGGTRSTHCTSCHFPLRAEGCFTCHKDASSHQLASPLPANHFPGMDCRQCHGLTAPLPHFDNGTDCEACHR